MLLLAMQIKYYVWHTVFATIANYVTWTTNLWELEKQKSEILKM